MSIIIQLPPLQPQRADLVVAPFTRLLTRAEVIDFASQPFYMETLSAVYQSPGVEDKAWQLVLPFRWEVWALVASSVPIAAGVLYALTRLSTFEKTSDQSDQHLTAYSSCLSDSYRAAFSQGMYTF